MAEDPNLTAIRRERAIEDRERARKAKAGPAPDGSDAIVFTQKEVDQYIGRHERMHERLVTKGVIGASALAPIGAGPKLMELIEAPEAPPIDAEEPDREETFLEAQERIRELVARANRKVKTSLNTEDNPDLIGYVQED